MSVMMFDHIFFGCYIILVIWWLCIDKIYQNARIEENVSLKDIFLGGGGGEMKKEKIWHGGRKSWWWGVVGVVMEDPDDPVQIGTLLLPTFSTLDSCLNKREWKQKTDV